MGLHNIGNQRVPSQNIRIELNQKGEILTLSNNWESIFKKSAKEMLYQPLFQILHPSCCTALTQFLEFESYEEIWIKLILLEKDEEIPIKAHLVKKIEFDNIEKGSQKHSTFSENQATKKQSIETRNTTTQERLDKYTTFLQQIGSTAKIGGWEVYLKDMHTEWTDETYRIHEVPINAEIKIEEAINFYHPDHRETISEKVDSLIQKGEEFDVKLKLITAKNNEIWVRALGKREVRNEQPYKIYGVFQDITQQVAAEDILKENEEKFRLISENSTDLICTHKADGTYKYVSPSSKVLLGYEPFELIGKNPYDHFHTDDIERISEESHKAVLEGSNPIIQYRFKKANGTYIWLETVSNPIVIHGKVDSIITISRDVTERKTKEQALITEEKRLKMALNVAKMGIWEWYVQEDRITWDENIEIIYGLNVGEFDGSFDMFMKYVHPEDRDNLLKKIQDFSISGEKEWKVIHKIINKKGQLIWLQGVGEMYFNTSGEPVYMIGVTTDITQKIDYEEEIKQLALVAENTDNSVIITDKLGLIEWVNLGFTKVTGYTLEEVQGKKPGDILQGEKSDKNVIKAMSVAIKNTQKIEVEIINYDKKKNPYWVSLDIQPIFTNDGSHKGFISVQRNVTQYKIQEKTLAEQNEDLIKANQELDNFVYRISHDLRAPVSSSIGLLDLANFELDNEEVSNENLKNLLEYHDLLMRSMTRMDSFISDILDYSRNTRVEVEYKEIDLYRLINDLYQQYRFLNSNSPLKLIYRIPKDKKLKSDPLRLTMILSNLISNSFKFADSTKKDHYLKIDAKWEENHINLILDDNGIGIPTEHQPKIFDMFFRASNQEIGSGLGLYIVKESLERINGRITLESEPGIGTTFIVNIPNLRTN